jgi:biopolymer transport protein ExbB
LVTPYSIDIYNQLTIIKRQVISVIKQKFIEGGPGFMGIVLLCLILGLALAIERIIYLFLT